MKLVQSALPLAVFLVFAIQPDVLRAWCFWLPLPKQPQTASSTSSPTMTVDIAAGSDVGGKSSTEKLRPDASIMSPPPVYSLSWRLSVIFSKPLPPLPSDSDWIGTAV